MFLTFFYMLENKKLLNCNGDYSGLADYTGDHTAYIFLGLTKPKKMSCNLKQRDLSQNSDFSGIQVVFLSES